MALYIYRRATNASAVNTAAQVNTDADGNTPGLLSPGSALKQLIVSLGASVVAVASAGSTNILRISGPGIQAQEDFSIGAVREDTTSTGGSKLVPSTLYEVDMSLNANQALSLATLQGGVDPGSPEVGVTMVFP